MASTSKHAKSRKRVLGASCILAALIIGGSSFAWFTAKDEVVNKLSADLRYNVVATENFTPPPPGGWDPGEKVTKEVGVVNTGNIDAIVATELKFNLAVNAIVPSNTAPTAATVGNYVKLTADEVTALQAGSNEVTDGGVAGLHIYKRTDNKYVGYYEVEGEYYALASLTYDSTKTPKASATYQTKVAATASTNGMTYANRTDGDVTYLDVTYPGADADSIDDDLVFQIELGAIGTEGDTWTHDTNSREFYYNQLLEGGEKSAWFIKSVTLSDATKEGVYADFALDIIVDVASAQVAEDETPTARVVPYNGIAAGTDRPAGKDAQSVSDAGAVTWVAKA